MSLSSLRSFPLRLTAVLVAMLAGRALAGENPAGHPPLGATPQQIAALYGPVLRHNARVRRHEILEGGTMIDGDLYSRDGLVIRVVYHGGVSVLLEYTRIGGPLTARDTTLLLAANTDTTSSWAQGKDSTDTNRYYRRSDGKAVAHYGAEYDGSLLIATDNVGSDFYGGALMDGH